MPLEDAGTSTSSSTTEARRKADRAPAPGEAGDEEVAGSGASSRPEDDGASPAGALIGAGAILVLGVAGALTVRRRRAVEPPEPPL